MNKNRQLGFGLIEVVISFIIVAVTAGALLQLNKVYLEYSRDGRYRETAIRLAESQLDELRNFSNVSEFNSIDTVTNGSGPSVDIDDMVYDISWDVVTSSGASGTYKDVNVSVVWNDGQSRSLSLASTIAPNLSVTSGPFGTGSNNFGTGSGGPKVPFNPGNAPDVIAITIDSEGSKQETSKPLPKVVKNDGTTSVQFDTVTYDASSDRLVQQDMFTISCNCEVSADGNSFLPSQREIRGDFSYWKIGNNVTKKKGVPLNNQPPVCDQCCANHFDGGNNEFSNWYDAFKWESDMGKDSNSPHRHYRGNPGNWIEAVNVGDDYLEACRFIRIDGFYRPVLDWNLIAFNIMDPAVLALPIMQDKYRSYVSQEVVKYTKAQVEAGGDVLGFSYDGQTFSEFLAEQGDLPDNLKSTDVITTPRLKQLVARGLYVDLVSPDYRLALLEDESLFDGTVDENSTPEDLLRYIPFYEINLTLLSDWSTGNGTIVEVSSEPVRQINEAALDYYGVYSRGRAEAKVPGGPVKITSIIRRSNSGVAAFSPLSEFEEDYTLSSTMSITVVSDDGTDPGGDTTSISGDLVCKTYNRRGNSNNYELTNCPVSPIQVTYNSFSVCDVSGTGTLQGSYNCIIPVPDEDITVSLSYQYLGSGTVKYIPEPGSISLIPIDEGRTEKVQGPCLAVVVNEPPAGANFTAVTTCS